MTRTLSSEDVERLAERLRDELGDGLQAVGVGWGPDDIEHVYVREDVLDHRSMAELEDIGVDLLADRHLEVGNLRRHGLEGPTVSGRLYDQALLVVSWLDACPVAVAVDPDPSHYPAVVEPLTNAVASVEQ